MNLYLLCGIPGSGKSTWAKHFKEENDNTIIISRDAIRLSLLKPNEPYHAHEKEEFSLYCNKIQEAIDNKTDNIIADATHMTMKSRNRVLNRLNLEGVNVIVVNFLIAFKECEARNAKRVGIECVPDYVMNDAFRVFSPAVKEDTFKYYDIINII